MSTAIQRRRGTDSNHSTFTGLEGEITVNTTNKSLHVHDGTTAGGNELLRTDFSNITPDLDVVFDTVDCDKVETLGGTTQNPSYTFQSTTGTGIYSDLTNYLSFATTGAKRMTITNTGYVGINVTPNTGSSRLTVSGTVQATYYKATTNNSEFKHGGYYYGPCIKLRSVGTSTSTNYDLAHFMYSTGTTIVGKIRIQNGGAYYDTTSDARLKENIQDALDAGEKIDALKIRQFDWKDSAVHQDYGVIAQEVEEVTPEVVGYGNEKHDIMTVDYSKFVPMLIKEIQQLRKRVAELEK